MSLATTGLAICEARGHAAFEDCLHQRLGCVFVDYLVVTCLVERVIESEDLILEILGEVDLGFGLVHHHLILAGHADHVDLLARVFLLIKRTFPHAHSDLMILHGVAIPQWLEFYAVLIFSTKVNIKSIQATRLIYNTCYQSYT